MLFTVPVREQDSHLDADFALTEGGANLARRDEAADRPSIDLENAITARQSCLGCRALVEHLQYTHLGVGRSARQAKPDEMPVGVTGVVCSIGRVFAEW